MRSKFTFGLYALEPGRRLDPLLNAFCEWLGTELDAEIDCDETPDYQTLARRVRAREIDVAWLPPIALLRAGDEVAPVAAVQRATPEGETALVVRDDSSLTSIADLANKRAAWVDAWSASGYVIPRLGLRTAGVDLSTLFSEEHFYGTHSGAVRAVIDGEADVAGSYALTDGHGNVIDGPWTQIPGARVRALATFGEIPADVFAVGPSVSSELRARLFEALSSASKDEGRRALIKELFGAEGFGAVDTASYAGLRSTISLATDDWDDITNT